MTSYLFIVNPHARNGAIGKFWPEVEKEIKKRGLDYSLELTTHPKHAIDLAKDNGKDFDVVVASGGDGTINEVANGLYGIPDTKLGLVNLGNGNDIALTMLYTDDYKKSLDTLEKGTTLDLQVALARADDNERYFVNIADTGVGATVSVSSFTDAKWLKGYAKYYYIALKNLLKYRKVKTKLQINNQDQIETDLVIVASGFGSRFGGGFNILPNNHYFMKDMAICFAGDIGKLSQVYLLNIIKSGSHIGKKGVHYLRARDVKLELAKPLPVEVEGEIVNFGATDVQFSVAEQTIKTIVPDDYIALSKQESFE